MLETFVLSACLLTTYDACQHSTQAYYRHSLQKPLTAYWQRNRVEAVENLALLVAATKERKLPVKLGDKLLTLDADQSIITVRIPF